MAIEVRLTRAAKQDVADITDWILDHDGFERASAILDGLQETFDSLSEAPERGRLPPELAGMGQSGYREVIFKAWRIVYRLRDGKILIYLIADGRRNMQTLLQQRLLRP